MSLAIFSPALPLTMVQSGPYSETQATPRISLRSFVTWLCSSQMMIMITVYNDDENKALLCGYRCHFSRWVIGAPKSGRRTSLSLASYGFFSHSTSFVYHPLKIFLVFSCPWLNLPSSSIWRWTLAWSSSLTVAGVQLGLHSSSPQGWMVKWTPITQIDISATQGLWRRGMWLKHNTARLWRWRCRRGLYTASQLTLRSLHILHLVHRGASETNFR